MSVAIVLGVLSCFGSRYAALFGLAAIVPAALSLGAVRKPRSVNGWTPMIAQGLLVAVSVLFFGWIGVQMGSPAQWPGPYGSVKRLAEHPGEHRLLCYEYSWCSVAIGEGNTKIFLDGRADPYPPKVWADFGTITHELPGWDQLLDADNVNSIIAWRGGVFEQRMQKLPNWYEISDTNDACCVLFMRLPDKK